ncbi:hypothetical protein N4T77_03145 [Clostridium sp. CX1]|uniref:Uncharacterized protein n=1 Tax=Clostridium tanneri TaxID=3037988 RepID=A0ABU4JVN7_9CLOT|nr:MULTISPECIES: hypothetical protein [unclassified Clostridium]MCT8975589.1 hypothetical protein [Clostridium sp. CX1]MDW8801989.1 hypothetical protein [Clostridium sp. A1-XYC3]
MIGSILIIILFIIFVKKIINNLSYYSGMNGLTKDVPSKYHFDDRIMLQYYMASVQSRYYKGVTKKSSAKKRRRKKDNILNNDSPLSNCNLTVLQGGKRERKS